MRAFIPASWIAVAVALVLLGGCILNKPEEFTEPCTDGIAKHDFGTTDLTTLARVSAFLTQGNDTNPMPVQFVGSVGEVQCPNSNAQITFVLEPTP